LEFSSGYNQKIIIGGGGDVGDVNSGDNISLKFNSIVVY
jgi:hypothetical protein